MQQTNHSPEVNKTVLLAVTMLSSFFTPFMGTAISLALKQISAEFALNATTMNWVVMSFLLSSAIFLVPFGKLADIAGRKKLFLIGNIILTIASLLCAVAASGNLLIIFRLVQGIGSAMIFSSSMAMITSAYPPQERGKIIGLNVSAVYLGLSASPVLGGLLTQTLGWRSIFYLNFLAGIFIITSTIFKIKTEWAEAKNEKFDFTGSLIYVFSITCLMYGFSQLPKEFAIIMTLAGTAGFILFIITENRIPFPVLNMQLFGHNKTFAFSNLAALINYAATFAITTVLSLYLQFVKGLVPSDAGLILITQPAVMTVVTFISGRLSDKYDPRILSSIGMAITVVGLIFLVFLDIHTGNGYLIASLLTLGLGFGIFSSPNTNAVMGSVEKKFLGTASATLSTMRLTGQMISMATATMVMHIFIGNAKISPDNYHLFMQSLSVIFIIFTVLCTFGVFASLARGKSANR